MNYSENLCIDEALLRLCERGNYDFTKSGDELEEKIHIRVDESIEKTCHTTIGETIKGAKDKINYDYNCKKLLSEKIILAWILKSCTEEFAGFEVKEIANKYIEGQPKVSEVTLFPGAECDVDSTQIIGDQNEDTTEKEGTVRYDIRFTAKFPREMQVVTLFVNVEAQSDFYPGYPIIKRGIYYGGRMISSQYGRVFVKSQYGKIHKACSIWICSDPPKNKQNTITKYCIKEEHIEGKVEEQKENYDLLDVVMVCLGDSTDTTNELLKLLDVLFYDKISTEQRKRRIEKEFQIPIEYKIEEGVNNMCNFSDGIERRSMESGMQKGMQKGIIINEIDLIRKKMTKLSIFDIADFLEKEVAEVEKIIRLLLEYSNESSGEIANRLQ